MKKGHNFRKLEIWKMSMTLVKKVYTVSQEIPKNEKYGLVSQIQRCAVSIPSNIADGSGRTTEKDFRYLLKIALSSSYELETQLILLHELYGLNTEDLILELSDVQNMIGGFIRSLNSN